MNPETNQPLLVIAGIPMSQEEYVSAQKNVRRISRLVRIALPVTAGFLGIITLALAAEISDEVRFLSVLGWLIFAAIMTLVTTVIQQNREKQAVANAYNTYRAMRGDGLDQIRFYSDHVESLSDRRRLAIPYTDILEFYEDSRKFVLYADGVLIVLPARGLTAEQAQGIYRIVTAGLPEGRITLKARLRPMLTEPIPVPDIPDRPVVPPKALHNPPLRLEEQRYRAILGMQGSGMRMLFSVIAGLLTGLMIDPAGAFSASDGLCVVVWLLLSQLAVTLFAHTAAKHAHRNVLGLSPTNGGITVYLRCGEMFVPRELIAVHDAGDGLMVQTPVEPLYLRYADLPDPAAVKRYFGL